MIGDDIRRKARSMTASAEALHQYFLSHPKLKNEGEGVVSISFEANAESEKLNMPLTHLLEDTKVLFGRGIIRDTEFEERGELLFYKHYFIVDTAFGENEYV